jgi:hypothetical protein
MNVLFNTANFLLSTAQWLSLGRLVLGWFIRNPANAMWQILLVATAPPYHVSRVLTGGRVPESWLWLVSLIWLMGARLLLLGLRRSLVGE